MCCLSLTKGGSGIFAISRLTGLCDSVTVWAPQALALALVSESGRLVRWLLRLCETWALSRASVSGLLVFAIEILGGLGAGCCNRLILWAPWPLASVGASCVGRTGRSPLRLSQTPVVPRAGRPGCWPLRLSQAFGAWSVNFCAYLTRRAPWAVGSCDCFRFARGKAAHARARRRRGGAWRRGARAAARTPWTPSKPSGVL